MGYIVIFKRLAGIPNVALLVRPIVQSTLLKIIPQQQWRTLISRTWLRYCPWRLNSGARRYHGRDSSTVQWHTLIPRSWLRYCPWRFNSGSRWYHGRDSATVHDVSTVAHVNNTDVTPLPSMTYQKWPTLIPRAWLRYSPLRLNSGARWYHGRDSGTVHDVSSDHTFIHSDKSPVAAHWYLIFYPWSIIIIE